jgi:hypothetical protein
MGIGYCIRTLSPAYPLSRPSAPPAKDLSTYQAIEREWKASQHYKQLHEMLGNIKFPFTLTKLIALSLGTPIMMSRVDDRSVLQHALITNLHSTLVQRGILPASSARYVQDPAYAQRDKDLLKGVGLSILEDPQAFLELDDSSMLVSIASDIPVKEIVADICRPGIIIWDAEFDMEPHRYDEPTFSLFSIFIQHILVCRISTQKGAIPFPTIPTADFADG